jgi:hypothetical protein
MGGDAGGTKGRISGPSRSIYSPLKAEGEWLYRLFMVCPRNVEGGWGRFFLFNQ